MATRTPQGNKNNVVRLDNRRPFSPEEENPDQPKNYDVYDLWDPAIASCGDFDAGRRPARSADESEQ
jgi:hypothetical protein